MYTHTSALSSQINKQITPESTFKLAIDSLLESKTRVPKYNSGELLNNIYSIITDDNSELIISLLQPVLDSFSSYQLDTVYQLLWSHKEELNELILQSLYWEELPNFISEAFSSDTTNQLERDLEAINWFLNNLSYQLPLSYNSLTNLSNILTF
jgi:hypothetical protein